MKYQVYLSVVLIFCTLGCTTENPMFDYESYMTHYTIETRMCLPRNTRGCQERIQSQQPQVMSEELPLTGCLIVEGVDAKWTSLLHFQDATDPTVTNETNIPVVGRVNTALFFFQNEINEASCANYSAISSCTENCIAVFKDTTDIIIGQHNVIDFVADDGNGECAVTWNDITLDQEDCGNTIDDNCNGVVNEGCAATCYPAGITEFAEACGVNDRGRSFRQCLSDYTWGSYDCDDADICLDGSQEELDCATNGTMTRVCELGQWRNLPCLIEGAACNNTSEYPRQENCGLNNRGIWTVECIRHERVFTECDDPDECVDNALRYTGELCGINRRGTETERCINGSWNTEPCTDPDECLDNSQQRFPEQCGRNSSGTLTQDCIQGQWSPDFRCEGDTDNCNNNDTRPCYTGPSNTRATGICLDGFETCTNGRWDGTCVGQTQPEAEVCDGQDNDCDGVTDNTDQSGQPCTNNAEGVCAANGIIVCMDNMEVCTAPTIMPGPQEVCDDSASDENCDGTVDENCACIVGAYEPVETICGTGVCARQGVTACMAGEVIDTCEAGQPLSNEDGTCDGLDQDCDGRIDEDFIGEQTICGLGVCATTGLTGCVNGRLTDSCTPNVDLIAEDTQCNNIDNDCDGNTDEGYEQIVTSCGSGVCQQNGQTSCVAGEVQDSCEVGVALLPDTTCNNIDEDCDGTTDEGFVEVDTTCGTGLCASTGTIRCLNGQPQDSCSAGDPQERDECNGIDEDCDTRVDEDFVSEIITCGVGSCQTQAATRCENNITIRNCIPGNPTEELCDNLDNDCDGTVDNGFGVGTMCTSGLGICQQPGTLVCNPANTTEAVCDAVATNPEPIDICDGLDNNCDGIVDETCCNPDQFSPIPTTCGVGVCQRDGELVCDQNGEIQENCTPGNPPAAIDDSCDGLDNDCDGEIDNDYSPEIIICGTGICARQGARTCNNGSVEDVCVPGDPDDNEICDGLDNDCDGTLDNDIDDIVCYTGNPDTENVGICQPGLRSCSDGQFGACVGEILPAEEICDGLDNDCDGEVDEGVECEICPEQFHGIPISCRLPGTFLMGTEINREVSISFNLVVMRSEVTQQLWSNLTNSQITNECNAPPCNEYPKNRVTWFEAIAFANELSRDHGLEFCYHHNNEPYTTAHATANILPNWTNLTNCLGWRLPTEAEWEFVTRSEQGHLFPWGDEPGASCERAVMEEQEVGGCGTQTTAEVCSRPLGNTRENICDLLGNVFEWTWDTWDGVNTLSEGVFIDPHTWEPAQDLQIIRGGSFYNSEEYISSTNRFSIVRSSSFENVGFRLVKRLDL